MAERELYPEVISAHAHGVQLHAERSFEDALRELVRNSPFLLVSLALHFVAVILFVNFDPPVVLEDDGTSIVSTVDEFTPVTPPEQLPPPEVTPPDTPLDDPTLSEDDPVVNAADDPSFTDSAVDSTDLSPTSVLGLGAGPDSFGDGVPGKLDTRPIPGGGEPYHASVEAALAWLAAHQDPAGYWSANAFDDQCGKLDTNTFCTGRGHPTVDVGVTALALLAFLGAGHTDSVGRHAPTVKAGLRWLKNNQDPRTGNFADASISEHTYDHALATLAMVEAYAMSSRKKTLFRGSAQAGVDYLLELRNPGAAWRYGDMNSDEMQLHANDVSVTGWAIMVLTMAKEVRLRTDPVALEDALLFIEEMTDSQTGRTGYYEPGGRSSRRPGDGAFWPAEESEAMTAVAMLCRIFADPALARPGNEDLLERGAALLMARPIVWSDGPELVGRTDFYYWYYASYALFQLGGKDWRKWASGIQEVVDHQVMEGEMKGSWDPSRDPWGADGGRVYSTALLTLTLEVYYRYDTVLAPR